MGVEKSEGTSRMGQFFRRRSTRQTERGKGRTDDSVAATDLLEQLRRGSEKHAAGVLARTVRGKVALALAGLAFEGVADNLELLDDKRVTEGSRLEGGDDLLRLGVVALGDEPTRRFGKNPDEADERKGENALQRDRHTPGRGRVEVTAEK